MDDASLHHAAAITAVRVAAVQVARTRRPGQAFTHGYLAEELLAGWDA